MEGRWPVPAPARLRSWVAAMAAVAAVAAPAFPAAAQAATPQQIIAALDAQRAAHGLPAGLVEDPRLSSACALHNRYLALNPGAYPHEEVPGRPGYTRAGAWAAPRSVLSGGGAFASGSNPFENAPFHLEALLRPALKVTGASESDGWTCVVIRGGRERRRPRGIRFYTYPGFGSSRVAARQVVRNEYPYAPGDLVGIPQGTPTGPHLYMYAFGRTRAPLRIRSASLEGPSGSVALRVVDDSEPGALMRPPSAILVPPAPLAPGSYCATVHGSLAGIGRFTHRWPFVTERASAGPSPLCLPPPSSELRLVKLKRRGERVKVLVGVNPRAEGRLIVTVDAGPGPRRLSRAGRPKQRGETRVQAFAGALPTAPGVRWLALNVHHRRTDGGPDARAGVRLKPPG